MKVKGLAYLLVAGMLLGSVACSNESGNSPDAQNASALPLVKAPDFLMYSGGQTIGTTFNKTNRWKSAYMNANMYDRDWDCIPNVDLTADELEELKGILCKGEYTENTEIFPYTDYWVQQVYKGQSEYTPTDINGNPCNTSVKGSDHMDKLAAYTRTEQREWDEYIYGGYTDENWVWHQVIDTIHHVEVVDVYEHINNFNNGNNTNYPGQCGCGIVHTGTTLMVDMPLDGVTPNNQFAFHESYGTSHDYNNYIIVKYKGEWYVGFDYEMHKKEAQNSGEAKDIERDWCFTDWIVKITPAYHKGMTPEQPEDEQPEQPGDDDTDAPIEGYDEVEINFSINDEKEEGDYIATKLSMHLRSATDIEVIIPVPIMYYCDVDDMDIVLSHQQLLEWHGGPLTMEKEIAGYTVSLNVEFFNEGIRVWTDGMNQEILDYCIENFNDGLTFEVWNYFNEELTREELQAYLNKATVEFLDKYPSYYINAFGEEDEAPYHWDCTVDIVDEQKGDFTDPETGKHLNGSHFNEIYTNKGI